MRGQASTGLPADRAQPARRHARAGRSRSSPRICGRATCGRTACPTAPAPPFEEYFDVRTERNGDTWFVVTTIVEDPEYLTTPFVTSTDFKKQPDATGWNPTAVLGSLTLAEPGAGGQFLGR